MSDVAELLTERREAFAQGCRDLFACSAQFLARAVLRSEASAKRTSSTDCVRSALPRRADQPASIPDRQSYRAALGVFLYLAAAILFLGDLMGMPQTGGLVVAGKIALVRPITIGVTVWRNAQRHPFFRRAPGDPPRFFAYVLNGAIAAAVAASICLLFHLDDADPLSGLGSDLPLILLSFILCTTVALCCDDWAEDTLPPAWLRLAEAAGCGLVMILGMGIVDFYLADKLPFPATGLPGWKLALLFGFPSTLSVVIGGFVPHIYRAARRAATARRKEANQLPVAALPDLVSMGGVPEPRGAYLLPP